MKLRSRQWELVRSSRQNHSLSKLFSGSDLRIFGFFGVWNPFQKEVNMFIASAVMEYCYGSVSVYILLQAVTAEAMGLLKGKELQLLG